MLGRALWFLPAASSEVLGCAMLEPFSPHFLIGNYPSLADPRPVTPDFYSYPFPTDGTSLGLTSLWCRASPWVACLVFPLRFFNLQSCFSGSLPTCLEVGFFSSTSALVFKGHGLFSLVFSLPSLFRSFGEPA